MGGWVCGNKVYLYDGDREGVGGWVAAGYVPLLWCVLLAAHML